MAPVSVMTKYKVRGESRYKEEEDETARLAKESDTLESVSQKHHQESRHTELQLSTAEAPENGHISNKRQFSEFSLKTHEPHFKNTVSHVASD